jgi:hypothetical protein
MRLFDVFLAAHIFTGSLGLLSFWAPVLSKKGGAVHRKWGSFFTYALLATGLSAIGMALSTLLAPALPHHGIADAALVEGIFGWMMLYLAVLTLSLAWHGRVTLTNKLNHGANRTGFNIALQALTIALALNCAWVGFQIAQPLMMGISIVGVASGVTNLVFIFRRTPPRNAWLKEHVKALVGAGISVYTAFLAFGAVRLIPQHVFSPILWGIPLAVGLAIILYHFRRIDRAGGGFRPRRGAASAPSL